MYERLIPPGLHKKFKHLPDDGEGREQMQSVCILYLKLHTEQSKDANTCGQNITISSSDGNSFVEKLDFADRNLHEICKKYKAFKIDFCDAYLVLCGIGSKTGREERHVINAAKMATEILSCDLTKEKDLHWQCVLHKGTVHTVLVNNGLPKCYVVGDPIEKAQVLLSHSQPRKILLSQDYYLNLKLIADNRFQTVFNCKFKVQVSTNLLFLQTYIPWAFYLSNIYYCHYFNLSQNAKYKTISKIVMTEKG